YFKLKVAETSTANGDETDFCAKVTAGYYEVVISSVEVKVETPYNFTYNGNTEYYVDYSTDAVNGETLFAYFSFVAYDGEIELDDWGFQVWGDVTEYTYNYELVYEGSGEMATLNKKEISNLTLRVNYNGTTSFAGIAGNKVTSTDIIKEYDINDFEKLTFSVTTSSKNVSSTAYTVDFADIVIDGDAAAFYTLAESGSASVYIDRKELTNLRLTTNKEWTYGGSVEITLTGKDGICSGEVVKVTVTNYMYQDIYYAGDTCALVLSATAPGQEEIAFVENDDYDNYVLVENDNGIVGTIMLTGVIKDVAFTVADIESIVNRGGMNVITVNLTTAHGIVAGHNVYLEIITSSTTGTISLSRYSNTVVKGDDADKYELGTGCTIDLGE
ncbi:MAG: hypothetical protein ACI3XS_00005, partial [Eubacteriales bacterium]